MGKVEGLVCRSGGGQRGKALLFFSIFPHKEGGRRKKGGGGSKNGGEANGKEHASGNRPQATSCMAHEREGRTAPLPLEGVRREKKLITFLGPVSGRSQQSQLGRQACLCLKEE